MNFFCFVEASTPVRHDSYGIHAETKPPQVKDEPVEMESADEEEDDEDEDDEDEEEEAPSE